MPAISEYFKKNRYSSKYFLGDRVTGVWNKIPFCGTVAIDTEISEEEGPKVIIFLDLPLKYKLVYYTIITVKHRDVKRLK